MHRVVTCLILPFLVGVTLPAQMLSAQQSTSGLGNVNVLSNRGLPGEGGLNAIIATGNLDVYIQEAGGGPVEGLAVVTLITLSGQVYRQANTTTGYIRFNDIAPTEYELQVVAPAYERAVKQLDVPANASMQITIALQPGSASGDTALAAGYAKLTPKAQKEMSKSMELLRANKPNDARGHLDALNRMAPNQAEVSYLYGVYSLQLGATEQAKTYWAKTLEQNPKHFRALLSLSEIALREKKAGAAVDYLKRAIETEPLSWRPHAILAEAYYRQQSRDEAIKEAERALDLGRRQAAIVERLLAQCLAERGERDRAISFLQVYLQDHPGDASAKKQMESLRDPKTVFVATDITAAKEEFDPLASVTAAEALPVPSSWLPPDVDESIPPVESGASCALDDVVQNAGKRLQELVGNVDRFTATEMVSQQSLNKWGVPSSPAKAQFDYIVTMEESRRGALSVEEYRQRRAASQDFSEEVITSGLPALVVIFHPFYSGNYDLRCEGLARWNGGLAWQVHFRQRSDKPNAVRSYKLGLEGPSYPVALKGRAWIAADTYQIVRLETNLVAPLPQIRLAAEHVNIEYAPVHFRQTRADMWLPANVEIYYDWRGRRVHRQHRFTNYLLFSVEDKQRISDPKMPPPADNSSDQKPLK